MGGKWEGNRGDVKSMGFRNVGVVWEVGGKWEGNGREVGEKWEGSGRERKPRSPRWGREWDEGHWGLI